jgi:hypothetical protein
MGRFLVLKTPFSAACKAPPFLSFQQHSRHELVSVFIFCNIPASDRPTETRPFVFMDIPASFPHF